MPGRPRNAPGINHRQARARTARQLIVKSERFALAWGGKTIRVVQDASIRAGTGLAREAFRATSTSEVNMLGLSHGKGFADPHGVIALIEEGFYAGPVAVSRGASSFLDIIRAPIRQLTPPAPPSLTMTLARLPVPRVRGAGYNWGAWMRKIA